MKINPPDWYPCYLNPDDTELVELANSRWDTVRILTIDEPRLDGTLHEAIILASGYGNTHNTLVQNVKRSFGLTRAPWNSDFILFKMCGRAYFTTPNQDRVPADQALRDWFTAGQQTILSELIKLSDLRYDS